MSEQQPRDRNDMRHMMANARPPSRTTATVQRRGAARPSFAGNQARLRSMPFATLQPKLAIGSASDPLEHEADRVAEHVMRMPDPHTVPVGATTPGQISRQCTACEDEAKKLQPKSHAAPPQAASNEAPAIVHDALHSGGQPLDPAARSFMEDRFGHSFADVRVHTGGVANQSAEAINALAYTVGNRIVFADGRYAPHTETGRQLLAHELTHTIQQGAIREGVIRQGAGPQASSQPGAFAQRSAFTFLQRACADKSYRNCSGSCVPADGRGTGFCTWSGSIATGCVCYRRDQPMLREIQQMLFNAIIAALIAAGIVLTIAAIGAIIACLSGPCEVAALIAACGYAAAMIIMGIIGGSGGGGASTGPTAAADPAGGASPTDSAGA